MKMAQYIDKDALDTVLRKLWKEDNGLGNTTRYTYNEALQDIQCEIDTLEVKEVDLEKEIQAFAKMELEPIKIYDANVGITITMHQLCQCAKHFFELGLKAAQKGK